MAKEHMTKPVVAYIAGFTAPEASRWATPAPSSPEARAPPRTRRTRSRRAGIPVGKTPGQAAEIMRDVLAKANID